MLEDAVESVLLVLAAAPGEYRTGWCLRLARTLRQVGKDVEVLLLQDAVLLPTQRCAEAGRSFDQAMREGVRFLVLEDDLRLRGYGKDDLGESAHLVTYRTAIRRMADGSSSVKGCF
jgi:sulfur transfer complex TusBCD TusB component (DsrH family)